MGRDAATSAPRAVARDSTIFRCSWPLMPRPTATMRSAWVRSTACFASWNGASTSWRIVPGSIVTGKAATGAGAAPRFRASGRNAPIWKLTKCGAGPAGATSATNLPWNIGRTNAGRPSRGPMPTQSAMNGRPSRAARRGANSRV